MPVSKPKLKLSAPFCPFAARLTLLSLISLVSLSTLGGCAAQQSEPDSKADIAASSAPSQPSPEQTNTQVRAKIGPDLTMIQLLPDTYVATDERFHQANVLVAKMDAETVLIASSPAESQGAQQLMDWIQKTLKPKRMIAINTHFHSDGTGGNGVYHQHGVETWAGDLTQNLYNQRAEYYRKFEAEGFPAGSEERKRLLARPFASPKQTFPQQQGKQFQFGAETAEVFYPGPAHTEDNVVVWLPKRKVLFGGCMIKLGPSLGYLADANVSTWEASATALKRFNAQYVIPGHGHEISDASAIDHTIELARQQLKG